MTRVNGASLVTGAYPARHGLVGNSMFVPGVDATGPFSTGEWRRLAELADRTGGRLLTAPTLAERLAARGLSSVAVSSGSTGSGLVLNPESRRGVGALISGGLEAGTRIAFPDALNDVLLARFGAAPTEEGAARLQWTERIVREHVLPTLRPALLIDWLTEPDAAQHTHGVGSPQACAALRNSDSSIAAFLETAAGLGLTDRLNVIVTSDHGFARYSEAVSVSGALVAAAVNADESSDDVMVVSNAQALAIHVKGRNRGRIQQVAARLLAQPWGDLVFTAASGAGAVRRASTASRGPQRVLGWVPGTFAIDLLRGQHAERGADLIVTLRWSVVQVSGTGPPGTSTRAGPCAQPGRRCVAPSGLLTLNVHRRCKPPAVALEIARPVLTLTIRLIDRLAVDLGTRSTSALVVCVDIIDVDDQAGVRHIDGQGRVEMVLGGDAV